jgi:hypothetical protein
MKILEVPSNSSSKIFGGKAIPAAAAAPKPATLEVPKERDPPANQGTPVKAPPSPVAIAAKDGSFANPVKPAPAPAAPVQPPAPTGRVLFGKVVDEAPKANIDLFEFETKPTSAKKGGAGGGGDLMSFGDDSSDLSRLPKTFVV